MCKRDRSCDGERPPSLAHLPWPLASLVGQVAGLEYDGYPTLLLYTATNRVLEAGEDVERTADALAAFIETHADGATTRTPPQGPGGASGKEEL